MTGNSGIIRARNVRGWHFGWCAGGKSRRSLRRARSLPGGVASFGKTIPKSSVLGLVSGPFAAKGCANAAFAQAPTANDPQTSPDTEDLQALCRMGRAALGLGLRVGGVFRELRRNFQ